MPSRQRCSKLYETDAGIPLIWLLTVLVLGGLLYPATVGGLYNNVGRQADADWIHHLFLRKEVALHLVPIGPRVLVVGGSGCLFSLDAAVLERELRQPVVNLCSHAGVGLMYMLARARRHARAGDTVLLAIEYRALNLSPLSQSDVKWNYFTSWDRRHYLEHGVLDAYKILYRIPFADIWKSREGWRKLRDGYTDDIKYVYDVMSMTPNGNLHESLGHREPLLGTLEAQFIPPSEYAGQLVASFAGWARGNGVRVLSAYQALALDPPDYWRKKEYFAAMPAWWKRLGIQPMGTPEDAVWPTAYFMDSLAHSGPAVAYQNALRVAMAMQGGPRVPSNDVLLLPPHPSRALLPFPPRQGAEVEIYGGNDATDKLLKTYLKGGRRILASTAALGGQLRARGFLVQPVAEEFTTPAAVVAANRENIILLCVRPDAPVGLTLDAIRSGQAWAGLWRQGNWTLRNGPATAELTTSVTANLATGVPHSYRLQIKAGANTCELHIFERDRYPSQAPVRMVVIDPERGIAKGFYDFHADLKAEVHWLGEVSAR